MISDEIEGIQTGWMFFHGNVFSWQEMDVQKGGSQRTAMTGMLQVTVTSLKSWSRTTCVYCNVHI